MTIVCLFISVVLITGGMGGHNPDRWSSEIYNPVTNTSCSLSHSHSPDVEHEHSQDGDLACGGYPSKTSCLKWSPASGTWTKSHTLRQKRMNHVSWATASGVYLIGGMISPNTSEKVKLDGSVEEGFDLKYDNG